MKKAALIVMIITVLVKLLGMLREITLSYYFGATQFTDAYLISLTIPGTLFAFIGTAIGTSFIPIYNDIQVRENVQAANRFTSNLVVLSFILCFLIISLFFFFPEQITKIFASGFDDVTIKYAVLYTKIGIISLFPSALIFIFTSYLQVKNSFIPAIISGAVGSIVVIISTIIASKYDIVYLSIGSSLSIFIQFLFMYPYIVKNGYKYKPVKIGHLNDANLKKMIFLSTPVLFGVSVNQINVLIDKTLASRISVGGISALTYADKLNMFIQGLFVTSLVTVFYPIISKYVIENNIEKVKKILIEVIIVISIVIVPISIISIIFSWDIVSIVFGRGKFDHSAITLTSSALMFYSLGIFAFAMREIISRVFFALKDTKTPMINAAIGMIANIVLNLTLTPIMGISGLALATSISAFITSILLYLKLNKKIIILENKYLLIVLVKIFMLSLIVGGVCYILNIWLELKVDYLLSLILSLFAGVVIYICGLYFLKINEVSVLYSKVFSKIKTKKS